MTKKVNEIEKKTKDHDRSSKYITTQKINKLTSESFTVLLGESN